MRFLSSWTMNAVCKLSYPHWVYTLATIEIFKRENTMAQHEREKIKLLQRVRKLRGQLDAVERALGADVFWNFQARSSTSE